MDDEEIPAAGYELDHRTCLVLLATERVGRLVVGETGPTVTAVRYAVTEDRVVVVGLDGSLPAGQPGDRVVMEADGIDRGREAGWSVVVHGRLVASSSPDELTITPHELTGRWVRGPHRVPPLDERGYL